MAFVLLGGRNSLFFFIGRASSTGVHRVKRKKDTFVLLGGRDSIFIGRRPDWHVSWFPPLLLNPTPVVRPRHLQKRNRVGTLSRTEKMAAFIAVK